MIDNVPDVRSKIHIYLNFITKDYYFSYCFMPLTHFIRLTENINAQISEAESMKGVLNRTFRIAQYICVNAMISPIYGTVKKKKRQSTDPVFFVSAHWLNLGRIL